MKLNNFLYATQYYRSPTPLPNEWEDDLSVMSKFGLNTIQIRINWRNNERKEDEYTFNDIDMLMDLAEKYHKQVIIKFLLECAPQYIFDKYNGNRIGPKGEVIRGAYHGAFYGGWAPCFTNPKVKERAEKFVKTVVERYHQRECIIMWNAWNEPRNRPVEDCFCEHCRKAYGKHLEKKFETIEKLNDYYGASEESFDHISLPSSPHGYWDTFEFKKFKGGTCLYDNLKMVYDIIRLYDKKRPIVSHAGYTAGFQFHLGDNLDDFEVSKAVDAWGTSVPCETDMHKENNRLEFNLLNDFLRCVCKDYLLYEVYPGLGMYHYNYDDIFDMDYKLFVGLGSGCKGINFWQYRSERLGNENDCAGLVRSDGSPRDVIKSVTNTGSIINEIGAKLLDFYKENAQIAILFDYDSLLLSKIEDACGYDYSFEDYWHKHYYTNSHMGFYRLMKKNNYEVDYVSTSNVKEISKYKVIYIPNYSMLHDDVIESLKEFANNGGIILADEGFGLRDLNTWVNPYDIKCDALFTGRYKERRDRESTISFNRKQYKSVGYINEAEIQCSNRLGNIQNYGSAINEISIGKGCLYLFSFGFGYTCFHMPEQDNLSIFDYLVKDANISKLKYADYANGLEEKRIKKNDEEIITLINVSEETKEIVIQEKIIKVYGNCSISKNTITIPKKSCVMMEVNCNE